MRQRESRGDPSDDFDVIGGRRGRRRAAALPLVEDFANVVAGISGGLVGAAAGFAAARAGAPPASLDAEVHSRSADELHAYLVEHGSRQDEVLRRLAAETAELGDIAVMQIAPDQGALITLLVRAIGARRALELGTFTGYSAICIARGLPADGRLRRLRARTRSRRDRAALLRRGRGRRPDRAAARPGARDAARDARRRAVRLRLHRRRQAELRRLLRGVPRPPAPRRAGDARQRPHAGARARPAPTTRARASSPSSTTASPATSASTWRCSAWPTAITPGPEALTGERRADRAVGLARAHVPQLRGACSATTRSGERLRLDGVCASVSPGDARALGLQLGRSTATPRRLPRRSTISRAPTTRPAWTRGRSGCPRPIATRAALLGGGRAPPRRQPDRDGARPRRARRSRRRTSSTGTPRPRIEEVCADQRPRLRLPGRHLRARHRRTDTHGPRFYRARLDGEPASVIGIDEIGGRLRRLVGRDAARGARPAARRAG